MTVKVDVPDYSKAVESILDKVQERATIEVQNEAKITAPVDTGFYRNNIIREGDEVIANAEYSASIEYGVNGTRRAPNPVMRNAGRAIQKRIPEIFRETFE